MEAHLTKKQYLAALKKLNLSPSGRATAAALGVTVRQAQRYAAGAEVPLPIVIILRLMLDRLEASQSSQA